MSVSDILYLLKAITNARGSNISPGYLLKFHAELYMLKTLSEYWTVFPLRKKKVTQLNEHLNCWNCKLDFLKIWNRAYGINRLNIFGFQIDIFQNLIQVNTKFLFILIAKDLFWACKSLHNVSCNRGSLPLMVSMITIYSFFCRDPLFLFSWYFIKDVYLWRLINVSYGILWNSIL